MNTYYHMKFSEAEGLTENAVRGEPTKAAFDDDYILFENGDETYIHSLGFAVCCSDGILEWFQYMTQEPDFETRKAAFSAALEARYTTLNEEAKKFYHASQLVKRATV